MNDESAKILLLPIAGLPEVGTRGGDDGRTITRTLHIHVRTPMF